MSKTITIPDDYTVDNTNNLGTMSLISGQSYAGSDISISDVRNKIGESTYDLSSLAQSLLLNKWAYFQPKVWDLENTDFDNGSYVRKNPTDGYRLGDFIGYNHNAKSPVYWYEEPPTTYELEKFTSFSLSCLLARGEGSPIVNLNAESATKSQIEFAYQFSSYSESYIRKALIAGTSPTTFYIAPTITENGTLHLRPYYYVEDAGSPGTYYRAAMCECGSKDIAVVAVNPMFTVWLNAPSTGTYGIPFDVPLMITRTGASTQGLYYRLRFVGSGVDTNYDTDSLGYISLDNSETYSETHSTTIISTTGDDDVSVRIYIDCSPTSDFSTYYSFTYDTIVMSGSAGGV